MTTTTYQHTVEQIVAHTHTHLLSEEHGEYVLLNPPTKSSTAAGASSATTQAHSKEQGKLLTNFEVVDSLGITTVTMKADGRVYAPGKVCPIGSLAVVSQVSVCLMFYVDRGEFRYI